MGATEEVLGGVESVESQRCDGEWYGGYDGLSQVSVSGVFRHYVREEIRVKRAGEEHQQSRDCRKYLY